jgi:hypothetical protein
MLRYAPLCSDMCDMCDMRDMRADRESVGVRGGRCARARAPFCHAFLLFLRHRLFARVCRILRPCSRINHDLRRLHERLGGELHPATRVGRKPRHREQVARALLGPAHNVLLLRFWRPSREAHGWGGSAIGWGSTTSPRRRIELGKLILRTPPSEIAAHRTVHVQNRNRWRR